MSLVECLSPTSQATTGPESGLNTSSATKELGEDLEHGRVPGEHRPLPSPSPCSFVHSSNVSSTRPKGARPCFSETSLGHELYRWAVCTTPSPSVALRGMSFCVSCRAGASGSPEACGGGSVGPWREAVFLPSDLLALALFLRDQFFRLAMPFLNHMLGWRVTECTCEGRSTVPFFV